MKKVDLESVLAGGGNADVGRLRTCYAAIKDVFSEDYYKWVQAACPFFTDHGPSHIASVIDTASWMVSSSKRGRKNVLSQVEVFLLLTGILAHDVAMVYGRSNHAERAKGILSQFRQLFPNADFVRVVNEIAKAHSGKQGLKIPRVEERLSLGSTTHLVRPRGLAGMLRFADEISENRTRVSQGILDSVPAKNRIYWEYANAIKAAWADPDHRRVVIEFSIEKTAMLERFQCEEFGNRCDSSRTMSLIEYVICRLEKINNERIYCGNSHMSIVEFAEVLVTITIVDNLERLPEYDALEFTFRDCGIYVPDKYPDTNFYDEFFHINARWRPEALAGALG
jgi:hypothetical protein